MTKILTEPCSRIVRPSKYEKQSSDAFNWWCRLFELMEREFKIPSYQRKEIIQEIFPQNILEKIIFLILKDSRRGIKPKKDYSTNEIILSGSKVSCLEANRSTRTQKSKIDLYCHQNLSFNIKKKEVGVNNPYLNFFKRRPDRAAIWRDLPPLSLDEMNLNQKAEAVTEAIAIDFINWLKKLGGDTETKLDVPQVVKMFEIGFSTHAATSLAGIVKELPAVTKNIADYRQLPQKASRAKLHRKLRDDHKLMGKKEKRRAFGTTLPAELQYIPPKKAETTKWHKIDHDFKYLQSMAAVWEGITDLRSTRAFCLWLTSHPECPAPKYLKDFGMLEASFFDKPHYSIDSQESGNSPPTKNGN